MSWEVVYSRRALKDARHVLAAGLDRKVDELIEVLRLNPFGSPPPFEKLVGNLAGYRSRRINIKHRLVYEVFRKERKVRVLSMWTHYGE